MKYKQPLSIICCHVFSVHGQDFQVRVGYKDQILAMIMLLVTLLITACSLFSLPSSKGFSSNRGPFVLKQ